MIKERAGALAREPERDRQPGEERECHRQPARAPEPPGRQRQRGREEYPLIAGERRERGGHVRQQQPAQRDSHVGGRLGRSAVGGEKTWVSRLGRESDPRQRRRPERQHRDVGHHLQAPAGRDRAEDPCRHRPAGGARPEEAPGERGERPEDERAGEERNEPAGAFEVDAGDPGEASRLEREERRPVAQAEAEGVDREDAVGVGAVADRPEECAPAERDHHRQPRPCRVEQVLTQLLHAVAPPAGGIDRRLPLQSPQAPGPMQAESRPPRCALF